MKNFLLALILLTSLSGCLKSDEVWGGDAGNLIFQSEYINYAWGYSHGGWMMDTSGQVKRFQKSAKWVFPDSLGYVSSSDMQKNLAACDSVLEQISAKDLTLYSGKAFTCVDGTMTKPQMTMADAGENIFAIYVYETAKNRYKRIILKETGDWSQENLAPNAAAVVDWMKTIK